MRGLLGGALIVAALCSVAGCRQKGYGTVKPGSVYSPPPSGGRTESQREYDRKASSARAEMLDESIPLHCDDDERDRCGLVVDQVAQPRYVRRFVRKVCDLDPDDLDQVPDECNDRFRNMIVARFVERYTRVPADRLRLRCEAHPMECESLRDLEVWLLKEHNATVMAIYRARLDEAEGEARHAERFEAAEAEKNKPSARKVIANVLMDIQEGLTADAVCRTRERGDGTASTACWKR